MADEQPPERPVNGVMVHRRFEPSGGFGVEVQLVGDMRITELATVLEHALALARRQCAPTAGDR